MIDKRSFMLGGVGAAAVAASLRAEAAPAAAGRPGALQRLQRHPDLLLARDASAYEAYLGEEFLDPQGQRLRLSEVRRLPGCARSQQFSLRFDGVEQPAEAGLQQLTHPASGQALALQLDAHAPDDAGRYAHFNLLRA